MAEVLGLEWWRVVWVPALSAGLIWLASAWKTSGESRGARDARLDGRLERENARLDRENDELRADRDRGWDLVRELKDRLHDMRHMANNRIHLAWIAGKHGMDPPEPLPPIPPLESMRGKPPQ